MDGENHNTSILMLLLLHCTEVRLTSFLSGGFMTAIVVNPPEKKLAKRTSVHYLDKVSYKLKASISPPLQYHRLR